MKKQIIGMTSLICLLLINPATASDPAETIAYSYDPHSGEVRYHTAQDLKRKITVAQTQTNSVTSIDGGPTFEISFADIDQGTGFGFDQPGLGEFRVNTVLAVFEYVSSILPLHRGTARVHFELSISDPNFVFAGQAFPNFPGYPCEEGYQRPLMYEAIVNNKHLGEIDGSIVINFGPAISWNDNHTKFPTQQQLDLYSLVLHEAGHALGFLGFAYDEQGSKISCDGQAAFPNFVEAIRNEADQPLWEIVDGVPTFVGNPSVDFLPNTFAYMELPGVSANATRLHKNQFQFQGESGQAFSGHWHTSVGTLMSNDQPMGGQRAPGLSANTLLMLNEIVGYGTAVASVNARGLTGTWFDPASSGQGFNIQFISEDRFLIFFYGFLDNEERFWLLGDFGGEVRYNMDLSVNMLEATGGTFNDFNPDDVTRIPWGTLTISFIDCNTAIATLVGPAGTQVFDLTKLAGVEGLTCE